jgi:sugar lactone lactonase YvrE
MTNKPKIGTVIAGTVIGLLAAASVAKADNVSAVELPGDQVFPESISAAADGTIYVSSLASGGIIRVAPGAAKGEVWIKPGAFDSRSTFGVLVDEKAKTLWVCSNDASGLGVKGPGSVTGSYVKGFDLATGEGKFSAKLPGEKTLCNDMVIGPNGSLFVTNSLAPQILRLEPGSKELKVWIDDPQFEPPKEGGAGLDGIAFGADGNLYVNTFTKSEFFRIDVANGKAGKVTKLKPSRALSNPDGLRLVSGQTFIMAEGAGSIDRVTVSGDDVKVETVKSGLNGPTAVALIGSTAWAAEGQLPHLFDADKNGPPQLPFHLRSAPWSE